LVGLISDVVAFVTM